MEQIKLQHLNCNGKGENITATFFIEQRKRPEIFYNHRKQVLQFYLFPLYVFKPALKPLRKLEATYACDVMRRRFLTLSQIFFCCLVSWKFYFSKWKNFTFRGKKSEVNQFALESLTYTYIQRPKNRTNCQKWLTRDQMVLLLSHRIDFLTQVSHSKVTQPGVRLVIKVLLFHCNTVWLIRYLGTREGRNRKWTDVQLGTILNYRVRMDDIRKDVKWTARKWTIVKLWNC